VLESREVQAEALDL
jgi:hypothetical protein